MNEGATGTVGAVAIDTEGNLAAATSTGGLANKRKGRVGDSPVNGAGVFADKEGGKILQDGEEEQSDCFIAVAVSLTGFGECFMRTLAAARVADGVSKRGLEPTASMEECMEHCTAAVGGDGGGVAVDRRGRVGVGFNSFRMGWGHARGGKITLGCDKGQVIEEDI